MLLRKLILSLAQVRKEHDVDASIGFMSRIPPGSSLLWFHLLLSGIMRTVHWLNAFSSKRQMLSDPFCQKNSQNKPFNQEQLVSCWLQTAEEGILCVLWHLDFSVPACSSGAELFTDSHKLKWHMDGLSEYPAFLWFAGVCGFDVAVTSKMSTLQRHLVTCSICIEPCLLSVSVFFDNVGIF